MTKSKKILTGVAAAVTMTIAALSVGTTAAEAGWKHKHHWHNKHIYGFYTVAPLAYYGYHNNCGWTWNKWGKQVYVCY